MLSRRNHKSGLVICLVGPDGTGKSTLAASIIQKSSSKVHYKYWRPAWLPMAGAVVGKEAVGVVTDPHGQGTNKPLKSAARVLYYFLDFSIGYWMNMKPTLRRGEDFVVERGWIDMQVDPQRYQLAGTRLVQLLTPLVPRPDITVILEVDPDEVLRRKQELSRDETVRQLSEWPSAARSRLSTLTMSGNTTVEESTRTILDHADTLRGRTKKQVASK